MLLCEMLSSPIYFTGCVCVQLVAQLRVKGALLTVALEEVSHSVHHVPMYD